MSPLTPQIATGLVNTELPSNTFGLQNRSQDVVYRFEQEVLDLLTVEGSGNMVNGQGDERGGALFPRVDVLWGEFKEVDMAVEGWKTNAHVYLGHLLGNALLFLGHQGTGAEEAVLVDTPITVKQTEDLFKWIETVAPKRKLAYIYITHGHGDHLLGIPVILNRFPEAIPVARPGVIERMKQQVEEPVFITVWESCFLSQISPQPGALANPLPENNQFTLQDRWTFEAVECGHADTCNSTILWMPDLKLAVCSDAVYGQVRRLLFKANTKTNRDEWIRTIEKVEVLEPAYVVPEHKQAEEIDGIWHFAATKKYIQDFGDVVASVPKDPREVIARMIELYPDRFNPGALSLSAMGVFNTPEEPRMGSPYLGIS